VPLDEILSSHSGLLIHADSLYALRALPADSADLIYVDPPFNTGKKRRLQSIELGEGEQERGGFGGRRYRFRVRSDLSYSDDMSRDDYLDFLGMRLTEARRALKETGSIYVHVDHHAAHHVRLVMDEVFGAERFLNEIIWAYDYGGRPRKRWPAKHDNILWYAKSDAWTFNAEAVERVPYMAPGLVGPEKAARGKLPTDVWWMTIVPTNSKERTGYPTQKPEKLLRRIIQASSRPGEVVLDFFAGSGTTGVVAERLGRKWILVDNNPEAVRITRERLDGRFGGLLGVQYQTLVLD
jgi:site-specific DNA-methyltransferase (adenine-specific)